jgi:hypothetical protein
MLDKECLQLSLYEYLKAYYDKKYTPSRNGDRKGLAVLTDEQYIFYGKNKNNDLIHYDIAMDIEAYIHPERPAFTFIEEDPNHTYIFLTEKSAIIEFPTSNQISLIQVKFLMDFLTELTKYNREVEEKYRIPFTMADWNEIQLRQMYDIEDIPEETIEAFQKWIIPTPSTKKERIIGKTLTEEEKEELEEQWKERKGNKK